MAMHILSKSTLRDFWANHPNARQPLQAWLEDAKRADWNSPGDIKAIYKSASIIANDRVIFNIKGNDYRLVAKIHYNGKRIYIRFIGTHAEYDKIDAETI